MEQEEGKIVQNEDWFMELLLESTNLNNSFYLQILLFFLTTIIPSGMPRQVLLPVEIAFFASTAFWLCVEQPLSYDRSHFQGY